MIRIVSFRKAMFAGAAGAAAWELVLRLFALAGMPLVDVVHILGTLFVSEGSPWLWWPLGLVAHMSVGALEALFYAYFLWSLLPLRPAMQGLVFGALVAVPAIVVVFPLLEIMHGASNVIEAELAQLANGIPWSERAGLLLGHLLYGAVLGALYTRPVGRPVDRRPRLILGETVPRPAARPATKARHHREGAFIFATGIECSYPTLRGGRWRIDQMEAARHYQNWRTDLELAVDLGVTHLRYGPPLHLVYPAESKFDWSFPDAVLGTMRESGLTPIVDLCHFGLPDWLENFQNAAVPEALRDYAAAFAVRYPWVRFYTPVNEMYVCARLSGLDGLWNEQERSERGFVTALRHLVRANILMYEALLIARPDAVLINSESGEFFQACCPEPDIVRKAEFENARRFLSLDLLYARPVDEAMLQYLIDQGMPREEYEWFMARNVPERSIMGVDYYEWNEKLIDARGRSRSLGELFGWYVIANQYYQRYHRPIMHTETNWLDARDAPRWLWRQWHNIQLIQKAGVPVVGFTWYSLTDQIDWDIALREPIGNVNPVGLFDLNRDPRPVAAAYKHLIRMFQDEAHIRDCAPLRELLD